MGSPEDPSIGSGPTFINRPLSEVELPNPYGLGIPITSEERSAVVEAHRGVYETYLHENQHVALVVALFEKRSSLVSRGLIQDFHSDLTGVGAVRLVTAVR